MIAQDFNTNTQFFIPSSQIDISIHSKPIVANIDDKLRGSFYYNDIKLHYHNTVGLKHNLFDYINWDGMLLATSKHKHCSQMLTCLHNQWPT